VGTLAVRRGGPLLELTLARPERRNALDPALIAELTEAFSEVGDARAILLAGEGRSFCAGADVEWMRASKELSFEENTADALRMHRLLETLDGCPAPVVARVQGHALGGACGLLACCDVVLAATDAEFAFSEVKLGIVPAVISPFVLARIGSGAARRLFVTGERFGAETALRIGLVHEVVPDLDQAVERTLEELLAAGPEAARAAKELARKPLTAEETAHRLAERRTSAEGQEGLSAFLDERPPAWRDSA
jgi:methylglutaconyl-CoA hydratase